ncbi:MAG TPA: enoyl-CoA hydratase/isomerase family protein [Methylovirgula sp.]
MSDHVLCEKIGHCGVLTLNRGPALNALTQDMIEAIGVALTTFAADRDVKSVVIKSASPRAFCAGADIKTMYEQGRAGDHARQMQFFEAEYRLDRAIARFPKPYIALLDGIVMGGGAGISLHGSHRVASETLTFAMPEVGIGIFPDVGASFFLSRLPHHIGAYLGMTGARIGLSEALALGLATAHVPSARFDAVLSRLTQGEDVDRAIAAEQAPAPAPVLTNEQSVIEDCFSHASPMAIVEALEKIGGDFAASTLKSLRSRSPTSVALALGQMQRGAKLDLDGALKLEFRLAQRIVRGHDYYEGVRTVLIDKGATPQWNPPTLEKIDAATIDGYFAPSPGGELEFETSK